MILKVLLLKYNISKLIKCVEINDAMNTYKAIIKCSNLIEYLDTKILPYKLNNKYECYKQKFNIFIEQYTINYSQDTL